MSGSMDDKRVEVLNVREDTALLLILRRNGSVELDTAGTPEWTVQFLRRFADELERQATQ